MIDRNALIQCFTDSQRLTREDLCDVIIDTAYQHMGLGTALVSHIESLPEFAGLRGILITRDAHDLYRKFSYEVLNERVMVKSLNC